MSATSRELVYQALERRSPIRAPRQLWTLPIAETRYPEELAALRRDYPDDFASVWGREPPSPRAEGDGHAVGTSTDAWGCTFVNIQAGVVGEVKEPLVKDWNRDTEKIYVPREWLSIDVESVKTACDGSDKFMTAGACPRPFEQLQFLRGSAQLMMDLADPPVAFLTFMRTMHEFYCEQLRTWAATPVDALMFMDDWGTQRSLLISPLAWREFFKPMYCDYSEIAHAAGKKLFMHSDGHILEIYPDLVEIGVDAVNSQIFCMGIENLRPYAGRITFWGEIDRQHLLPNGSQQEIDRAVQDVYDNLWRKGGCIAQCEFGPAARPENVRRVFHAWDAVRHETVG